MPRAAAVHPSHRPTVRAALKRNGFLSQGALAVHLELSLSTVNNFCRGANVYVSNFEEISEVLGLDASQLTLNADVDADTRPAPEDNPLEKFPERMPASEPEVAANFFAYDSCWVGREALTAHLLAKLQGACRLLLLVGISGVGKTALGERLALSLTASLTAPNSLMSRQLIRENFDYQESALDFGSFAARLLEKCDQPVMPEERQDAGKLRRRLTQHLIETPYLLIIDSLEVVLSGDEAGQSEFDDEGYLLWLQQMLAAENCCSRIIITSQAMPAALSTAAGRYPNFWHEEVLLGLSVTERLELFKQTGFDIAEDAVVRRYLERIGEAYSGHPLALRVITGEIGSRPFFGNVVAYWKRYGREIESVEEAIAQAAQGQISGAEDEWKLDRLTQVVQRNVRQRLEQTFQRLTEEARFAYLLLCSAAVYRCGVPEDWWLSHLDFWTTDGEVQRLAMEALRDRCLVEESLEDDEWQVKQHNLIRSVALAHLDRMDSDSVEEDETDNQNSL